MTLRLLDFMRAVHHSRRCCGEKGVVEEGAQASRSSAVERSLIISENSVQHVWAMPLDALPCKTEEVFLEATLEVPDLDFKTASVLFLTEPKRCALEDPGLEVALESNDEGALEAKICATAAPAFYVSPELEDAAGQFEDAGFYCAKVTTEIRFIPAARQPSEIRAQPSTKTQTHSGLRVYHLQNSFEH